VQEVARAKRRPRNLPVANGPTVADSSAMWIASDLPTIQSIVAKPRQNIIEPMTDKLKGKIAVVAGASRGCGRGIAVALGEQAAIVYVTGRTIRGGPPPVDGISGVIEETAEEVTRRGGVGIPVQIDHTDAGQCKRLFDRVHAEHGRLDIFACAVWGGNERFVDPIWKQPFWELPVGFWDEFMGAGPQAFWIAARAQPRKCC